MNRVALVTCRILPEPDPDEAPLLEALRRAGLEAELLPWDDPGLDPGAYDLCVLRSCWNYYEQPERFLEWIAWAAATSRLANPIEVVRWNLHKGYLRELEERGVPVIPTAWVAREEGVGLGDLMRRRGWSEVVVKPAVSAASFGTRRIGADEIPAGQEFLETFGGTRDMMVQPYLTAVESVGERALVWIDGELTHAVRKSPRFAEGDEHVSAALTIGAAERDLAERALACIDAELLYARIDVVPGPDGELLVSELELMEPSLFLCQFEPARERLVEAIRNACA